MSNLPPENDEAARGGAILLYVMLGAGFILCAGSIGGAGYFGWRAANNTVNRGAETEFLRAEEARRGAEWAEARVKYRQLAPAVAEGLHDPENRLADSYSREGKPLLSWRVHLLPRLGHGELYNRFKLNEPWDSPANKKLLEPMPDIYAPASKTADYPQGSTLVRGMSFPGAIFEPNAKFRVRDLAAKPELILAVFDANDAIPWTTPDQLLWPAGSPRPGVGGSVRGYDQFLAITLSGKVVGVRVDTADETLRQLFDRNQRPAFEDTARSVID